MQLAPLKILIVDDTPENLVVLDALLRRDGVELLAARSGAEALELLLVHEVALAVVRQLRALRPAIRGPGLRA